MGSAALSVSGFALPWNLASGKPDTIHAERPTMGLGGGKLVKNRKNLGQNKKSNYLKAWPSITLKKR